MDALPVAHQLRDLLADALMHLDAGLHCVGVGNPNQKVSQPQMPLHKWERTVAMKRRPDVGGGTSMPEEEDVLPRDLYIVKHDHRLDLVESIRKRIVVGRVVA